MLRSLAFFCAAPVVLSCGARTSLDWTEVNSAGGFVAAGGTSVEAPAGSGGTGTGGAAEAAAGAVAGATGAEAAAGAVAGATGAEAGLDATQEAGTDGGGDAESTVVPRNGLVLELLMDGSAADTSGWRNDGLLVGDPPSAEDRSGRPGGAYHFDGARQHIEVRSTASLDFGTGDFTVSAWIATTAVRASDDLGRMDIVAKGDPYNDGLSLGVRDNRIGATAGASGRVGWTPDSPRVNDGAWHFAAAVRRKGEVAIFFDSERPCHQFSGADSVSVGTDLFVGQHGTKDESFFWGLIDDVRVYNRALSEAEILALLRDDG